MRWLASGRPCRNYFCLFSLVAISLLFAVNKLNSPHDIYAHLLKYFTVCFMIVLSLSRPPFYRAFGMIMELLKDERNDDRKGWGVTLFAALVAFLIQGMFENVHSGPPAIVFYLHLAMITVLWKESVEKESSGAGVKAIT
jgi:hypothetical protein